MSEPERTTTDSEAELALFESVRRTMADPSTYAQPPLADRYAELFDKVGLRAQ